MTQFIHQAIYSNIKTIEFLRTLTGMSGVDVTFQGYAEFGFMILFTADTSADLYLRLKYGDKMYSKVLDQ